MIFGETDFIQEKGTILFAIYPWQQNFCMQSLFLLQTNEENEYRITFKKENNKVEHMTIHSRDSVYLTGGNEEAAFSSLRRLVDHLKEER